MSVKLSDLSFAIETSSEGDSAVLCRKSGRIYYQYQFDPSLSDKLPKDVDDEEKYVWLPDKRELGLGKPLALSFIDEFLPRDFDLVREIFGKRGAYGRFHDLLIRRNARDKWHAFAAEQTAVALREWCVLNEIEVTD